MKPLADDGAVRPTGRLRFSGRPRKRSRPRTLGARLLTTIYRRMLFLTYPLDQHEIPVYTARIDATFRILDASDIATYARFRPDADSRDIAARFESGHRCFASIAEGKIVDACWMATGSAYVPYMKRHLVLASRDIYSYDSFTLPEYRACGIYMARNSFTARLNREEGFVRSVSLVAFENYGTWLILTRSGLETRGIYAYVRLPGRGIYWQRGVGDEALIPLAGRPPLNAPAGICAEAGTGR